jgi:serine kinase of HPr protein (carbohydrate metabolism regulator)
VAGETELVHGTAIALEGAAALIRGPSAAGKSDLALRCLGQAPNGLITAPCRLIADDQVRVTRSAADLTVTAPAAIAGLIEVRGVGVVTVPTAAEATLRLVVDLVAPSMVPRLPDAAFATLHGIKVPLLLLAPFEAATPLKVLLALDALRRGQFPA